MPQSAARSLWVALCLWMALGLGYMGCTPRPPQFETADRAPLSEERGKLHPTLPESMSETPSRAVLEEATRRFFLALSVADKNALARLLADDAMLRRGSSATSNAPLTELLALTTRAGAMEGGVSSLIRYSLVEVNPGVTPSLVLVDVPGPGDLQGHWQLRFTVDPRARIEEIVLPSPL